MLMISVISATRAVAGGFDDLPRILDEVSLSELPTALVASDENNVILGYESGAIQGWNISPTGELVDTWKIKVADARITGLDVKPGLLAAACGNDGAILWTFDGDTTPTFAAEIPGSFKIDVALNDNFLYIAAGFSGLQIYDISNPANPDFLNEIPGEGFASRVKRFDNLLFIGEGEKGVAIIAIAPDGGLTFQSRVIPAGKIADFARDGDQFVLALENQGAALYDITNPAEPNQLDVFNLFSITNAIVTGGGFAIGGSILATFNTLDSDVLAPLALVRMPGGVAGVAVLDWKIVTASFDRTLSTIDILAQKTPMENFRIETGQFINKFAFSSSWLVTTGPANRVWFFSINENTGTASYLNEAIGYNFSALAVDDNESWAADADRSLEIFRFDDINDRFDLASRLTGISGNATDIAFLEPYIYVAAGRYGFRILERTGDQLIIRRQIQTSIAVDQILISGNKLFVRNQFEGVHCYVLDNPLEPLPAGSIDPWMAFHASALGDYLFLSRRRYGVDIWSFADTENPSFVSNLPFFDARMALPLNDQALLVADSVMGTAVIDWSTPAAPRMLCHLAPKEGEPVTWIEANDTLIAIAEGSEISIIPREDFFPPVVGSGSFWFLR